MATIGAHIVTQHHGYKRSAAGAYPTVPGSRTWTGKIDDADYQGVQFLQCPDGEAAEMEKPPGVIIVDDDRPTREAAGALLRSAGFESTVLTSAKEFLAYKRPDAPCCLILEVRLPGGTNGLSLHRELVAAEDLIPTIFITAHGDVPMAVEAMKRGAVEFLLKPFRDQDLIDAVELAIARDRSRREQDRDLSALRERFGSLSEREREAMAHVIKGRLNKQIAALLGITEATVKAHRSQVMRKMMASSLPELALMAAKLNSGQSMAC
jgi:FixJ family two-component response regulator